MTAVKQIARENYAQQVWEQEALDRIVENCMVETENTQREPLNYFGLQCSSKAAEFVYCMWKELFLTCPSDKQANNRNCQKLGRALKASNENKFKI